MPDLRDYLLGCLSPEQELIVEDAYFSDPSIFDELRAMEDDLVDEFIRGELNPEERRLFIDRFLSTAEGEEKVAFARALALSAAEAKPAEQPKLIAMPVRRIPWLGIAGAIAAMLVVTVGLWKTTIGSKQPTSSEQASAGALPNSPSAAAPVTVPSPSAQTAAPEPAPVQLAAAIPTVTLQAGFNRNSGQAVRVTKRPGVQAIRMRAPVETAQACQVEIQTPEERVVWSQASLKPTLVNSVQLVQFQVPAHQLPDGMYIVRVTPEGRTHADEFAVEVVSVR